MEVLFLHAPKFINLKQYYDENLQLTYELISVDDIYAKSPLAGIRIIINSIVDNLQSFQKLAVIDSALSCQKFDSYVDVLKRKVNGCKFSCLSFRPKYNGQVCYMREFQRCIALLTSTPFLDIYDYNKDELKCNGVKFTQVNVSPILETDYKLEVAGLFIELASCLSTESSQVKHGVLDAINNWSMLNPCGRVILISHKSTNLDMLRPLCAGLNVPVFVIEGDVPTGSFHSPPSPGLVVLMIGLLHLDIHDSNTCFIYQSSDYRSLAHRAGIRHCPARRVFSNSQLITSPRSFTKPEGNLVLSNLELKPLDPSSSVNSLYSGLVQSRSNDLVTKIVKLTDFLNFNILAKSEVCCKEFDRLYRENASKLSLPSDSSTSAIKELSIDARLKFYDSRPAMKLDKPARVSKLPDWLLESAKSPQKKSPVKSPVKVMKHGKLECRYVLNEKELLDTARSILAEYSQGPSPSMVSSSSRESFVKQKLDETYPITVSSIRSSDTKTESEINSESRAIFDQTPSTDRKQAPKRKLVKEYDDSDVFSFFDF